MRNTDASISGAWVGSRPSHSRSVSFEIPSGKITGQASYLVEPTGETTSRLVSEVHFRVSGLAGLATPILARVFERDSKKNVAALKELLEHAGT